MVNLASKPWYTWGRRAITPWSQPGRSRSSTANLRVNVTIASPRAAAWKRYFDQEGLKKIDGDASDGRVTYQFKSTARVVVPETVAAFELRR
ncbi:DUF7289 family protein [Haladaptatus sp. NG-SE-30]